MAGLDQGTNSNQYQSALDRLYGNTKQDRVKMASAVKKQKLSSNGLADNEEDFKLLNPGATVENISQFRGAKAIEQLQRKQQQDFRIADAARQEKAFVTDEELNTGIGQLKNFGARLLAGASNVAGMALTAPAVVLQGIEKLSVDDADESLLAIAEAKKKKSVELRQYKASLDRNAPGFDLYNAQADINLKENTLTEQEQALYQPNSSGGESVYERMRNVQQLDDLVVNPIRAGVDSVGEFVNRSDDVAATQNIVDVNDADNRATEGLNKVLDGEVLDGLGDILGKGADVGIEVAKATANNPLELFSMFTESIPQMAAFVAAAPVALPAAIIDATDKAVDTFEKEYGRKQTNSELAISAGVSAVGILLDSTAAKIINPIPALKGLAKQTAAKVAAESTEELTKSSIKKLVDKTLEVVKKSTPTGVAKDYITEFGQEVTQTLLEQYAGTQDLSKLDTSEALVAGTVGGFGGGLSGTIKAVPQGLGNTANAIGTSVKATGAVLKGAKDVVFGSSKEGAVTEEDVQANSLDTENIIKNVKETVTKAEEPVDADLAANEARRKVVLDQGDALETEIAGIWAKETKTPEDIGRVKVLMETQKELFAADAKIREEMIAKGQMEAPKKTVTSEEAKTIHTKLTGEDAANVPKEDVQASFYSLAQNPEDFSSEDIKKLADNPNLGEAEKALVLDFENYQNTVADKGVDEVSNDIADGKDGLFKGLRTHVKEATESLKEGNVTAATRSYKRIVNLKSKLEAKLESGVNPKTGQPHTASFITAVTDDLAGVTSISNYLESKLVEAAGGTIPSTKTSDIASDIINEQEASSTSTDNVVPTKPPQGAQEGTGVGSAVGKSSLDETSEFFQKEYAGYSLETKKSKLTDKKAKLAEKIAEGRWEVGSIPRNQITAEIGILEADIEETNLKSTTTPPKENKPKSEFKKEEDDEVNVKAQAKLDAEVKAKADKLESEFLVDSSTVTPEDATEFDKVARNLPALDNKQDPIKAISSSIAISMHRGKTFKEARADLGVKYPEEVKAYDKALAEHRNPEESKVVPTDVISKTKEFVEQVNNTINSRTREFEGYDEAIEALVNTVESKNASTLSAPLQKSKKKVLAALAKGDTSTVLNWITKAEKEQPTITTSLEESQTNTKNTSTGVLGTIKDAVAQLEELGNASAESSSINPNFESEAEIAYTEKFEEIKGLVESYDVTKLPEAFAEMKAAVLEDLDNQDTDSALDFIADIEQNQDNTADLFDESSNISPGVEVPGKENAELKQTTPDKAGNLVHVPIQTSMPDDEQAYNSIVDLIDLLLDESNYSESDKKLSAEDRSNIETVSEARYGDVGYLLAHYEYITQVYNKIEFKGSKSIASDAKLEYSVEDTNNSQDILDAADPKSTIGKDFQARKKGKTVLHKEKNLLDSLKDKASTFSKSLNTFFTKPEITALEQLEAFMVEFNETILSGLVDSSILPKTGISKSGKNKGKEFTYYNKHNSLMDNFVTWVDDKPEQVATKAKKVTIFDSNSTIRVTTGKNRSIAEGQIRNIQFRATYNKDGALIKLQTKIAGLSRWITDIQVKTKEFPNPNIDDGIGAISTAINLVDPDYKSETTDTTTPEETTKQNNMFGKPVINQNLLSTIAAVSYEWLATRAEATRSNEPMQIAAMLQKTEEELTPNERKAFRDVGISQTKLEDDLGGLIVSALGLKVKDTSNKELQNQLRQNIGQHAVRALQVGGHLTQTWVTPVKEKGSPDTFIINPNKGFGAGARVFLKANFIEDETNTSNFTRLMIDPRIAAMTASLKSAPELMNKLAGTERKVSDVILDVNDIPEVTTNNAGEPLAREQRDSINKAGKRPHKMNSNMMDVVNKISDFSSLLIAGFVEDIEGTVQYENRPSVEAVNASLVKQLDDVKELDSKLKDTKDGFFYQIYSVAKNLRMHLVGNGVNAQAHKMHRHMVGQPEWDVTIDPNNEVELALFKAAVAETIGIKVDKMSIGQAATEFDAEIKKPVIQKALEAIKELKSLKEGEKLNAEMEQDLLAAVKEGGEKFASLHGLMAISDMSTTQSFSTNISREMDGITNGVAIGLLQFVTDGDSLQERLIRTGISLDSPLESMGAWLADKNNQDTYQNTTRRAETYFDEGIDSEIQFILNDPVMKDTTKELKIAELKEAREKRKFVKFFLGNGEKSFLGEDGQINKEGRNYAKWPLMLYFYGAGKSKVANETRNLVKEAILKKIEKAHLLEDTDARQFALDQIAENITGMLGNNEKFVFTKNKSPLEEQMYHVFNNPEIRIDRVIDITYGAAMQSALDESFGDVADRAKKANEAVLISFVAFKRMFDKRIDDVTKGKPEEVTEAQVQKVLKDLSKYSPTIATAISQYIGKNNKIVGGINYAKQERRKHDQKHSGLQQIDDDTKATAKEKGIAESRIVNEVFRDPVTGKTVKRASITSGSAFSTPGQSVVTLVQSIDASTIVKLMQEFGVLNVHDASLGSVLDTKERAEGMNGDFININSQYSIMDATTKAMNLTMKQYAKEFPEDTELYALNDDYEATKPAWMQNSDEFLIDVKTEIESIIAVNEENLANRDEHLFGKTGRISSISQYNADVGEVHMNGGKVVSKEEAHNKPAPPKSGFQDAPVVPPVVETDGVFGALRDDSTPKVSEFSKKLEKTIRDSGGSISAKTLLESLFSGKGSRSADTNFKILKMLAPIMGTDIKVVLLDKDTPIIKETEGVGDALGYYNGNVKTVFLKSSDYHNTGTNELTIAHELVHAVTTGIMHKIKTGGKVTKAARKGVEEINGLFAQVQKKFEGKTPYKIVDGKYVENRDKNGKIIFTKGVAPDHITNGFLSMPEEMIAYGLTDLFIVEILRDMTVDSKEYGSISAFTSLVKAISNILFGDTTPEHTNALGQLVNLTALLAQEQSNDIDRVNNAPIEGRGRVFTAQFKAIKNDEQYLTAEDKKLLAGLSKINDKLNKKEFSTLSLNLLAEKTDIMKSMVANINTAKGNSHGSSKKRASAGSFDSKYDKDITKDNTFNIFEDLGNDGAVKDTKEHTSQLHTVLEIINRSISALKLKKRQADTGGETIGEYNPGSSTVYLATNSGAQLNNIEMSAQETFVHELLHSVLNGIDDASKVAVGELNKLYQLSKSHIKIEDFMADPDLAKTDPSYDSEYAAAKSRFDHVYNTQTRKIQYTDKFTGLQVAETVSNHLHEFAVMGTTNAQFIKALSRMDARLPNQSTKGMSFFDKITHWLDKAISFLSKKISGIDNKSLKADKVLLKLVENIASVENRHKSDLYNAFSKATDNVTSSADNKIKGVVGKLAKLTENSLDSKYRAVRILGGTTNTVASGNTAKLMSVMGSALKSADVLQGELATDLVAELKGVTDGLLGAHKLLVKSKHVIDKARASITDHFTKYVNGMFGQPLSEHENKSLTRLLKKDFTLLVDTYGMDAALDILDGKTLNDKLNKVASEITRKFPKEHNFYTSMAENLGHYLVTKRSKKEHLLLNAGNIAHMAGTEVKPTGDLKEAERLIDILASLHAIKDMDFNEKAAASVVARREIARTNEDGSSLGENNGFHAVVRLHKEAKSESAVRNFDGNEALMEKGYLKETFNPKMDVTVANEKAGLELVALGYEKHGEVIHDKALINKEKSHYYILRNGPATKHVSGAFSITGAAKRGTDLLGINEQASPLSPALGGFLDKIVVKSNKKAAIREIVANGGKDVSGESNTLVPVLNSKREVVGYRYIMNEETRINTLQRQDTVAKTLGTTYASINDKAKTLEINKEILKYAHEEFVADYDENPDDFIEMSLTSKNKDHRDAYRLLPDSTRNESKKLWKGDKIYIKKEHFRILFGYKAFSVSQLKKSDDPTAVGFRKLQQEANNAMVGLVNNQFGRHAEAIWQEIVGMMKDTVVIKNITTTAANNASNFVVLKLLDVPVVDIVRDQAIAYRGAIKYQKNSFRIFEINQELSVSGLSLNKRRELQKERNEFENELRINPVKELIHAGALQTIIEDIDEEDDTFSYKNAIEEKMAPFIDKVPGFIKTGANHLALGHDTAVYKILRDAAQLSDFAAKYALHQHNMKRAKNPMTFEASIRDINEVFISYDVPTSKSIQYMNDMGLITFTKYYLRVQKVILKVVKEKPANAMILLMSQGLFGDVPDILDSSAVSANLLDKFNFNLLNVLGGVTDTAPLNLLLRR